MRGHFIDQWTTAETLTLRDHPDPALSSGEVRIAVHAAGVNFADGLIIAGKYQEKPAFPFAPGFEVSGEIIEIAPPTENSDDNHPGTPAAPVLTVGQKVWAVVDHGGYADTVVARQTDVYPLPAGMDMVTAAGFPVAYGTSDFALMDRAALKPGETVLIHGAASGVGLTAVECARAAGATVIATARDHQRLEVAKRHGATHLLLSDSDQLRDAVRELTGGRGVDVVYDPVGGALCEQSLRCMAVDGRLLVIGFAGGSLPTLPANHLLVKNLTVTGFYWGAYRRLAPRRIAASFARLAAWYDRGLLSPEVSHTFPLTEAPRALQALKERQVTGKAVLICR